MRTDLSYEEQRELGRAQYAKASPRERRYKICSALNMTCLSIEMERLERVGVAPEITKRWKRRAQTLLNDILDVSDIRDEKGVSKNLPTVEKRMQQQADMLKAYAESTDET